MNVLLRILQKINNWFGNKRTANNYVNKNPFDAMLKPMILGAGPMVKHLPVHKVYMSHEKFGPPCKARALAQWQKEGRVDDKNFLAFEVSFAAAEYKTVSEEVQKLVEKERERDFEERKARKEAAGTIGNVGREQAL